MTIFLEPASAGLGFGLQASGECLASFLKADREARLKAGRKKHLTMMCLILELPSSVVLDGRAIIIRRRPFKSIMHPAGGMMLFLIRDVVEHPAELLLAEADDAEAALPFEDFVARLMIDVERAAPLEFTHDVADADERLDVDSEMNVCLGTADAADVDTLCSPAAVF